MARPFNLYGIVLSLLVIGIVSFLLLTLMNEGGRRIRGALESHRILRKGPGPVKGIESLIKSQGGMDAGVGEDKVIDPRFPEEGDFLFLFEVLEDENPAAVLSAAKVLGEIGDSRGVIPLLKVETGDDEVDRFACGTALQILRVQGLVETGTIILEALANPAIGLTPFCRGELEEIKERIGLDHPQVLRGVLASPLPANRAKEYALARLFGPGVIRDPSLLIHYLKRGSPEDRLSACLGLAYLGYENGIESMERALPAIEPGEVRDGCRDALRELKGNLARGDGR